MQAIWGDIWKHTPMVKRMQPMLFRIYSDREFETAFESWQWREAKNATDVTDNLKNHLKIPPHQIQEKDLKDTF